VKVRFQADADLNEDIITGFLRREPAVDFQTATTAGLRLLSDSDVLSLAARAGRVLVSHDRRTMPRTFAAFVSSNVSPGLFIVSQKADLLIVIDELLLVWSASEAEEWTNQLFTIPFSI
jgi:Domain of unknown function (DUF5615)